MKPGFTKEKWHFAGLAIIFLWRPKGYTRLIMMIDLPLSQASEMEELFTIIILHNGVKKELPGKLRISAYTHQFIFTIDDSEIIIEKDDGGNFRALTASAFSGKVQNIDPSLVQALINEMKKEME